MTDWADLESELKPVARFPVEPRDKLPGSEVDRQAAFRKLIRHAAPNIMSWAVPNAGKRGFKAQALAKREGLTAGVFDEHYAWNHGYAFLEWKDGKGALSPAQIEWGNAMHARGFRVACARTPEFALALFSEWGAPVNAIRKAGHVGALSSLPAHLEALQSLVNRCESPEAKKHLIVTAGACEAIDARDGHLMLTANQLETA